ncbi:MAG: DUF2817 domain-containing protein [Comamonadaceae bacterium]|nr:MAG: DUF2817 domain-containing protein [Comamonadaceae bacterium]
MTFIPATSSPASFAGDYAQARDQFLHAARGAGAGLRHYRCPATGPRGEALFTDVAWVGDRAAPKALVAISGTHGVEGFCGSGFQVDWLRSGLGASLPDDTCVLFIHAINPYGFAWLRRVNEDGVDLNRNYLDPGRPPPENPGYDEMAHALVPSALTGPVADEADAFLAACRQRMGDLGYFRAVASGQYRHPDGLFYGGAGPTWSNRTLHEIIRADLSQRQDIAVIDFHTGLGPFGHGDLITDDKPGSDGSARVRQFWGDSVSEMFKGQTAPLVEDGPTPRAFVRALPQARLTIATLEFGTYDRETGRKALRADHWLHKHADPLGPQAAPIKQALRRQYYPDTVDWKEAVLFRGHQVARMALAGLQGRSAERGHPAGD